MVFRIRLSLLTSLLVTSLVILGGSPSVAVAEAPVAHTPALSESFGFSEPISSVAELRELESRLQEMVKKVIPTTVAIRVGQAHGSGVIISPDGYVLTAAHVAMKPDLDARVRLHDGTEVRARTLGVFRTVDAGLIKITTLPDSASWPTAPMGNSGNSVPGEWCFATGHPGGFQDGREPILRGGRILEKEPDAIRTDCLLIGGDSGGPLFNLDGHVIGIHSRIGKDKAVNLHVPVNEFRINWDRLVAREEWGELPGQAKSYIGVQGDSTADDARITKVIGNSPAMKGGILTGDVIVRFGGSRVTTFESLSRLVRQRHPGDRVTVEVLRGSEIERLNVTVGKDSVEPQ